MTGSWQTAVQVFIALILNINGPLCHKRVYVLITILDGVL